MRLRIRNSTKREKSKESSDDSKDERFQLSLTQSHSQTPAQWKVAVASANRARSAESGTWRGLDLRHGEAEGSTWTAGPDRRPGRRDAAGWNVPAPRLLLFDFVFLHSALVILFVSFSPFVLRNKGVCGRAGVGARCEFKNRTENTTSTRKHTPMNMTQVLGQVTQDLGQVLSNIGSFL